MIKIRCFFYFYSFTLYPARDSVKTLYSLIIVFSKILHVESQNKTTLLPGCQSDENETGKSIFPELSIIEPTNQDKIRKG